MGLFCHAIATMLITTAICDPDKGINVDLTRLKPTDFDIYQSKHLVGGKFVPKHKIESLSQGDALIWAKFGSQYLVEFDVHYLSYSRVLYVLKIKTGDTTNIFHLLSDDEIKYIGVSDYLTGLNKKLKDKLLNKFQTLDIADYFDKLYYDYKQNHIHTSDRLTMDDSTPEQKDSVPETSTTTAVTYEAFSTDLHLFKEVREGEKVIWTMDKTGSDLNSSNYVHFYTVTTTTQPSTKVSQGTHVKEAVTKEAIISRLKLVVIDLKDKGHKHFKYANDKWVSIENEEYMKHYGDHKLEIFNQSTVKKSDRKDSGCQTTCANDRDSNDKTQAKGSPVENDGNDKSKVENATPSGSETSTTTTTLDVVVKNSSFHYNRFTMFKSKFVGISNPGKKTIDKILYNGELLYEGKVSNFYISLIKTEKNDHFIELRYAFGTSVHPTRYYKWAALGLGNSSADGGTLDSTDKEALKNQGKSLTEITQKDFFNSIDSELDEYKKGTNLEFFDFYGVKDGLKIDTSRVFEDLSRLTGIRFRTDPLENEKALRLSRKKDAEDSMLSTHIGYSDTLDDGKPFSKGNLIAILGSDPEDRSSFISKGAIISTSIIILIQFLF